ncbi:MAG: MFS transporter [Streptosporangiales bacterium]|nr:MFS transporter [Streptosporangiales bacterium]
MAISAAVRSTLTLSLLAASQVVLLLDATIINVALASIQRDLHTSPAELSWVANAYTLVFSGLLLLEGRAGDILGHRRVFTAGAALFTVASLVGGLAYDTELLLLARRAAGRCRTRRPRLAGADRDRVPRRRRQEPGVRRRHECGQHRHGARPGRGGLLIEWGTWRWTFFINVPVGVAVAVLSRWCLHESPRLRAASTWPGRSW